jgi:hypothetical protein
MGLIFRSTPNIPYKFCEYIGAGLATLVYTVPESPLRSFCRDESVQWINYGNREALKESFEEVLQDPEGLKSPGENLRTQFSLARIIDDLDGHHRS